MFLTRQTVLGVGIGSAALAAVALAAANFAGASGENGGAGPYAVTLVVSIAVAVGMFGWAIPRSEHPGRTGLAVAVLALLSVPFYWLGLPYVLGPAAAVLGLLGRARSDNARAATAAVLLGALATIAGVFVDYLAHFVPAVASGAGRSVALTSVFAVIVVINYVGVRHAAGAIVGLTVAKLAPLVLFVVVGLAAARPGAVLRKKTQTAPVMLVTIPARFPDSRSPAPAEVRS